MLEKDLIKSLISQDTIVSYHRFVDDIFCIVKKGSQKYVLDKMNEFDPSLSFTMESMTENRLTFLDTSVCFINEDLCLEQYRKPSASNCLINFKHAVSPKSYKISTLCGEIHRANNCTTTPETKAKAFKKLESIFVENQYPRKMVREKIKEISDRDFQPSSNKLERLEQQKNPHLKFTSISLPYTSFRCSHIAFKIYKLIEKYTPQYRLNIAFSTIKLSSIIFPTLKPQKNDLLNSHTVYKFTCPCSMTYIGETIRLLETRILEHRHLKSSHICKHISDCETYKSALLNNYGENPSDTEKRAHFKTLFTIVEKNLHNYYARTTFEGLMITLQQPELNKQVYHRSTSLICNCVILKNKRDFD